MAKTTKIKEGSGRPEIKIDWEFVDALLQAQCIGTGIANIIGINPETLYRKCQEDQKIGFSEYSAIKKTNGKELLRSKQYEIAMSGDKTMLVWLGKNILGQSDKQEIETHDSRTLTEIFKAMVSAS